MMPFFGLILAINISSLRLSCGFVTAMLRYQRRSCPTSSRLCRSRILASIQFEGFSISDHGFNALLKDTEASAILAVPVDAETGDRAKSVEALTLLQLFQGIDMGGAILPPEILNIRYAEETDQKIMYEAATFNFREASPWLRLRCLNQLKSVALERVCIRQGPTFELCCKVDTGALVVPAASAFEALALALRHRVPIVVGPGLPFFPAQELDSRFPFRQSAAEALEQQSRVSAMVRSTAEASRLEMALKIARERKDYDAEKRIMMAQMSALNRVGEMAEQLIISEDSGGGRSPGADAAAAAVAAAS